MMLPDLVGGHESELPSWAAPAPVMVETTAVANLASAAAGLVIGFSGHAAARRSHQLPRFRHALPRE